MDEQTEKKYQVRFKLDGKPFMNDSATLMRSLITLDTTSASYLVSNLRVIAYQDSTEPYHDLLELNIYSNARPAVGIYRDPETFRDIFGYVSPRATTGYADEPGQTFISGGLARDDYGYSMASQVADCNIMLTVLDSVHVEGTFSATVFRTDTNRDSVSLHRFSDGEFSVPVRR